MSGIVAITLIMVIPFYAGLAYPRFLAYNVGSTIIFSSRHSDGHRGAVLSFARVVIGVAVMLRRVCVEHVAYHTPLGHA